ncbi:OPT superfamily oligopeptide transporter [Coemansia reversa NRRL 1564]|uniref:OPT superfamily oligopeptide transporter n=1 Tax=Coemansia reversa (strain ATCC 12441 / NRRL 1564) TaxID=763665 RepID=A0A2G5BAT1_COERN|nr:OPT superfamily oligopeptide transporter [Coemansia reversa NRRL 1564]|eukprot:PIA16119.1 OPT superfamily oligopeptide transporter [Coemansia reversa NRRL 1564]
MTSLTFRVLFLGTVFTCTLAFVNMYYWFRSNPITLGIPVVQLLSLPMGWVLAQVLPRHKFNTFGLRWSMNPGPFTIKEHALISIFANASTSTVYALDIIVVRRFWIGPPLAFGAAALLSLTSQLLGYSFSGLFHGFLVEPDAMIWPSTLVNVTLFRTLQAMLPSKKIYSDASADKTSRLRLRLFWIIGGCSFAWYFVPGWFFPTLTMLPILCFIAPKNKIANQMGDGYNGMGMLALTLDWSTISNTYTGSPLATPWFAACNLFIGFVLVMWIISPIGYYSGVWEAKTLPIYSNKLFSMNNSVYNVSRVLKNGRFDNAAYERYGPMRMCFQFLTMYGFCFMGITCLISHVALHHGADLWQTAHKIYTEQRTALTDSTGRQREQQKQHTCGLQPRVPLYWYLIIFVATMAMGLGCCQAYGLLPWYGFILAIVVAGFLTLPVGLVEAISNFQYALGVITELLAGYIWPGEPTYNVTFKMFGYITMRQALMLSKDQKLGQYMKVPPRHLFFCQVLGTIIAVFVQLGTSFWLMNTVENICTEKGFPFTCRQGQMFYSTMVIWGVFGPQRQFGGTYGILYWMFLVGVFLPLPFWLLKKKYPHSIWRYVNIPIALTYVGYMPNAPTHDFVMFTLFCFIFNYVILKYRSEWWHKYNFAVTAALDTGLAISGIIGYFVLQSVHVEWWGTQNHCPLSKDPFYTNKKL